MSVGARVLKWQLLRAYARPPITPGIVKIYADPGTGLTTVDGYAQRTGVAETWNVIRTSPGLSAFASTQLNDFGVGSALSQDMWQGIARLITTHSLAVVPLGAEIIYAKYYFKGSYKVDSLGGQPQIAVYQSYPLADNNIVAADYQRLYNTPLSNLINYADFVIGGFNIFTLNDAGLALLLPGQICRLGLREAKYDAPGLPPTWRYWSAMYFQGYSVEASLLADRPYLEISYQ